ncbi:hypothetical protein XENOCAPTIV_018885 [Xenoophorus captivus]|uniref:Uncharacterized protein n=1 Tax=Xenoophorus captivus TaxID=1517983 RepID=A0ABV0R127_9TELE
MVWYHQAVNTKKNRRLTPATFIQKMYGALQGRYTEHIMCHNRSEKLLLKQGISKDIAQSQEGWAKRDGDKPRTGSSSYFSTPSTVPVPKRGRSAKNTGKGQKTKDRKSSSNTATSDGTKPTMEVICADI